ncbi:major facilitator superfamily transporter [Phlyctema vagabunda]|uniref:Major facilitator superfamily transporter n=1 Tax=Phlyctema vagabunda TaxID=108571 RepID=A0ABR4PW12_9HELO
MASATKYNVAKVTSDDPHNLSSPDSPSTSAQFTPQSDSDDSDFGENGESFKMKTRRRDAEKQTSSYEDGVADGLEAHNNTRRASMSTIQSFQLYTPDEERRVVRKLDKHLVLFVALLYCLSFLDRSNIGNANIAGLARDLDLDSSKYEWVLTAFYIAYIAFEWMSVLWKLVPAHIYVTVIVLSWGIVASLQSCATSFAGLLVLRFMLGIGEAGFTGIPFYLSFFFKREELALRTGLFISAAPLSTSFASTLAWAIIKIGERSPIASWRLLFLVEGFPSVIIAVIAWHVIPDNPGTAQFFTKRDKKVAKLRLRKQEDASRDGHDSGLTFNDVIQTILDPKCLLTAFMFFCTNMAFSSMPVFLPTIIHEMGHSTLVSQALSAPPFLASFVVVILTAWYSDRMQSRGLFICAHALLSAFGYALVAVAGLMDWGIWWRYAGLFPAAIGFFSVITIIITWTINNQESEAKQGIGFAMLQLIGQCGPLLGTRLYPNSDAPFYIPGMSICAAAMLLVALLSLALRLYLSRRNARNQVYEAVGDEGHTLVSGQSYGRSTRFKYIL